jgi:hypothetical protein
VTIAGFGCAGARVDVTQPAPSEVLQPDFIIVERFGVSPEDVKLDRGLSAQALRGFTERPLNDEERKVGAAVGNPRMGNMVFWCIGALKEKADTVRIVAASR